MKRAGCALANFDFDQAEGLRRMLAGPQPRVMTFLSATPQDDKGAMLVNLGASLAFFGMEDWALELAQQSFSPYWGASHLFLADRYPGEFNKNSELFQGFLTDPMAFGASQRF